MKIILLDVDGVLVQPCGYRAAAHATLQYFLGSHIQIDDDLLTDLEKRGIASEWDMTPLIIASYWNLMLLQHPTLALPDDVSAAAQMIKKIKADSLTPITIPHFNLVNGQYPSDSALQANCFDSIPYVLRKKLLSNTRSIRQSATMKVFQHFTLGSKHFTETYHLPAEFESESYLLKYDKSNINNEIKEKLLKEKVCIFTARPSGVASQIAEATIGYAPEAELAVELIQIKNVPIIAFGKLDYFASQNKIDAASLIKPAAFHALAATLAACTGDEWFALQAAYQNNFSALPKKFELIVVEDTLGGIRATQTASQILQRAGFVVKTKAIGLTSGNPNKAMAFKNNHVIHFAHWDGVMQEIFE